MPQAILYPSGAGSAAGWTPSAGTLAAALASLLEPYAFAAVPGARFRLAMDNLPASAVSINSVTAFGLVAVDTEGDTTRHGLTLAGDDVSGAAFTPPSGGYDTFSTAFPLAPDGAAWTVAKVNAAEWGLDVVTLTAGFQLANHGFLAVDYEDSAAVTPPGEPADLELPSRATSDLTLSGTADLTLPSTGVQEATFPGTPDVDFPSLTAVDLVFRKSS